MKNFIGIDLFFPRYLFSLLISFSLLLTSCAKEEIDRDYTFKHAYVVNVVCPSHANVNETIPVEIYFGVNTGCGQFGYFKSSGSEFSKTVSVMAKYQESACTMIASVQKTIFEFHPQHRGTYQVRIEQPDDTYLDYNIEVQ